MNPLPLVLQRHKVREKDPEDNMVMQVKGTGVVRGEESKEEDGEERGEDRKGVCDAECGSYMTRSFASGVIRSG